MKYKHENDVLSANFQKFHYNFNKIKFLIIYKNITQFILLIVIKFINYFFNLYYKYQRYDLIIINIK